MARYLHDINMHHIVSCSYTLSCVQGALLLLEVQSLAPHVHGVQVIASYGVHRTIKEGRACETALQQYDHKEECMRESERI